MMFPDMNTACRAAGVLRTETAVDAVEVFDRASLRECEADEGLTKLVVDIKGADPGAAALLIECRGEDAATLQVQISTGAYLAVLHLCRHFAFQVLSAVLLLTAAVTWLQLKVSCSLELMAAVVSYGSLVVQQWSLCTKLTLC